MARLKLSAPWDIYYEEVSALFKYDPEVRVVYDEDNKVISLYVDNQSKADALTELLPTEKTWGNVTLGVKVIPSNKANEGKLCCFNHNEALYSDPTVFDRVFEDNPIYCFSEEVEGVFTNKFTYVIFEKEVVQFFTDDIGDYYGLTSTLYEDIARDVFDGVDGVFFCTADE